MSDPSVIDVAVGVIARDDGRFLLAQRPEGKPMAGWWEFPGGKLERDESVLDALIREYDEELGLTVLTAHPWVQRVVSYPHATVRLHFWRSFGEGREWRGTPRADEGQDFRWEHIDALTTEPWLKGAEPVRRWLRLPAVYAISNATQVGVEAFLESLDGRLHAGAIQQLQLREPGLDDSDFEALFVEVAARCRAHRVRLLVNSSHAERWWHEADGVHLTARDLMRIEARPSTDWCLASCHDHIELMRAGEWDMDAAVLGPVRATASHPGRAGLGWSGFEDRIARTTIPVYALGGLGRGDRDAAIEAGAHGIAMIRGAWVDNDATMRTIADEGAS